MTDEQERGWGGKGRREKGWYRAIKPASDTQSTSHALAQAIVVWNLRNAFDQYGVSVWVLFWTTPGDKTATREGIERIDRGGGGQGLPDEYMYFYHRIQHPVFSCQVECGPCSTREKALQTNKIQTQYCTV